MDEYLTIECRTCKKRYKVPESNPATKYRCKSCGDTIEVNQVVEATNQYEEIKPKRLVTLLRIIAAGLLFWAFADHAYIYYQVLRFVVTGVALYTAYIAFEMEKKYWIWVFGIVALLFNPLVPIHMQRESWAIIDTIIGVMFILSIIMIRENNGMNIFKTIGKIIGTVFVIIISLGLGYWGYAHFKNVQKDRMELSYKTSDVWEWYDKKKRIQIQYDKEKRKSTLRKVYPEDKKMILVWKNEDYTMSALAFFFVECTPNTEIVTTKKYSDGSPIVLKCNPNGNAIYYSCKWNSKDTDFTWSENLDGFKIQEYFNSWDFTKLDQEITLLKAK